MNVEQMAAEANIALSQAKWKSNLTDTHSLQLIGFCLLEATFRRRDFHENEMKKKKTTTEIEDHLLICHLASSRKMNPTSPISSEASVRLELNNPLWAHDSG